MDLVLAAFYSGQQGSLLYWAWTLSIFTAIVLWQQRKPGPHRVFMPYVVAVLMIIEAFMTLLLGFVASPFEALPGRPPTASASTRCCTTRACASTRRCCWRG